MRPTDRFSPFFTGRAPINFDAISPLPAYQFVYSLPPDQIRRLAYFFNGTSQRVISRPVHDALAKAIVRWRERFWNREQPVILASIPLGNSLLVRDTRAVALEEFCVLEGDEARVLHTASSPIRLERLVADHGAERVESLLSRGFMVRGGDQVLSVVKEHGWQVRDASQLQEQPCGTLRAVSLPVSTMDN